MKNRTKPVVVPHKGVVKIAEGVKITRPQTISEKPISIENLPKAVDSVVDYLKQDVRGGSGETGVITYNGFKRSPGKFYGGVENPITHSTSYRMNYDGRFSATQLFAKAFFYTSDANEKTNVGDLDQPLNKLLSVKGVSFDWKSDGRKDAGVIAQEVAKVIPEAVNETDGKLSVNPSTLIAYLIESIRELKNEIDELKNGKEINKG